MTHACMPLAELDWGMLWRCSCGQLWQLSPSQGRWITVSSEDEAVLVAIFGDLAP
jgi:hypothetical protein